MESFVVFNYTRKKQDDAATNVCITFDTSYCLPGKNTDFPHTACQYYVGISLSRMRRRENIDNRRIPCYIDRQLSPHLQSLAICIGGDKPIQYMQILKMQRFLSLFPLLLLVFGATTWAFTSPATTGAPSKAASFSSSVVVLEAGGFEWEDPTDEQFDQGVDNPFKNPELIEKLKKDGESDDDDDTNTIDPARLLGPRLQGSNLYLVGMMGSGKSSVGDVLARRKWEPQMNEFV